MDAPRVAILLALLTTACAPAAAAEGFGTDFEAASRIASETGRPLLIHFYADYCPPCRRMEREVLHDPLLMSELGEIVVAVKVNTAKRPDLARRFNVDRIPHDRVVSPDGTELARSGGFVDKWGYLATVRGAVQKFADAEATVLKTKKVTPKNMASSSPAPVAVSMDGYCPVTLHRSRKWLKGNSTYEVEYKGLTYRMHSEASYDLFRASPQKYAPQVLGCDPVVLAASHRAIPGRTDFGAFFDGKLYLFESGENRTQFKKSPLKYVRIRHALDVSKIERTAVR